MPLFLRLLSVTLLWASLAPLPLLAQKKPKESADVLVSLRVAAFNATDTFGARIAVVGEWDWNANQGISQLFGPWSPQTSSGWSQGGVATALLTPNVSYVVSPFGTWSYGEIKISAPPGYQVYINDIPGEVFRTPDYAGSFGGPRCSLVLRPIDASNFSLPAGEALSPRVGDMIWQISAGSTTSGVSAGAVQWRTAVFSQALLEPSALVFASPGSTEFSVDYDDSDGALSSISSRNFYFTVVRNPPGTPGYAIEIRNELYQLFCRYVVSQPDVTWQDRIRIEKKQTDVYGNVTSTKTWTIGKSGPNWTITEAAGDRITTLNSSINGSGNRVEVVEVKDTGSNVAAKSTRTYQNFSWGQEEMIQEVADPDGLALVTDYTYFTTSGSSSYGRLKTVKNPDGSWSRYDYDDTFTGWGNLIAVYRPWQDNPTSPDSATAANCHATLYSFTTDYVAYDNNVSLYFADLPSVTETKINTVTTAKTQIGYSALAAGLAPNYGDRIQQRTIQTWSGSSASTTTYRWDYHRRDASEHYRGNLLSQKNPDGTMTSALRYKAEFWNYGDDPATKFYTRPEEPAGIIWGEYRFNGFTTQVQDSVYVDHWDSRHFDPVYMVPNRSTVDLDVFLRGRVWFRVKFVFTGASGGAPSFTFIGMEELGYSNGVQTYKHSPNGYTEQQYYDGLNRYASSTNDGIDVSYSFDDLGREYLAKKTGLAATTEYAPQGDIHTHRTFDAAGRVLTEKISSSSSPSANPADAVQTTRLYSKAGLLTSETAESTAGSFTTTHTYTNGGRTSTTTFPDGATKITDRYLDGTPKSVTGTGVVAEYFSATINTDGSVVRQTTALASNGARWNRVTTDWAGRTTKAEKPAYNGSTFIKQYYYNSVGQLFKTTETGLAAAIIAYNSWQQPYLTGLDLNANGTIHLPADFASTDRITETDTIFEVDGSGAWWEKQTTKGYNQDNNPTPYTQSVSKRRLNKYNDSGINIGSFVQSEMLTTDIFGNQTHKVVEVRRYSTDGRINDVRLVTETTTHPDSTVPEVKVTRNGLVQKVQSRQNLVSWFFYDGRGRLLKQTDPRTDTSSTARVGYVTNSDRVAWRQDSAGNQTNFTYQGDTGRLAWSTDPLGNLTYHTYTARGEPMRDWGSATYPVEYEYNDYGERTKMRTWRTHSSDVTAQAWGDLTYPSTTGDLTTWTYEAATGLQLSKTDAANKSVTYTYNARGQLATRTWARNLATTYTYSATTAEQLGIDYGDSTPDITYAYNRLGQNISVTDGTGTRFIDHCVCGKVVGETLPAYFDGRKLTYTLSSLASGVGGRTTGFTLSGPGATGTDYAVSYGYDSYGRFNSLASPAGLATTYTYRTDANLIASIGNTSGYTETMTYESNRDLLASITGAYAGASKAAFAYQHDTLGRRTSVSETGEIFSRYVGAGVVTKWTYNDRSEVVTSKSYFGQDPALVTTAVPSRDLAYTFDNIGSRTESKVDTVATTYANNALNQVTSRTAPAATWVTGLAPSAATVTVNSQTADRVGSGDYYSKNAAASGTLPLWQSLAVASTLGGSSTRYAYLAATPESYTYDLDGNLLDDGRWHYTWDAENRLTSISTSAAAMAAAGGTNAQRVNLSFVYDYLGRRVRKTVATWNGSTFVATVDRKFIYDGWNLIAEHDVLVSGTPAVSRYAWGLDLSKTLQDGGGVGGLLAIFDVATGAAHFPAYDGNGNIHALVSRTNGAVTAAYEYDAFGQTIRATGSFADKNPFRFSTKYTDSETGLLYYGRRYYNPQLGRWLGRDPIEEKGGLHLYGMVRNNPVNLFDVLGMGTMFYTVSEDGQGGFSLLVQNCGDNGCDNFDGGTFDSADAANSKGQWYASQSTFDPSGWAGDSGGGFSFAVANPFASTTDAYQGWATSTGQTVNLTMPDGSFTTLTPSAPDIDPGMLASTLSSGSSLVATNSIGIKPGAAGQFGFPTTTGNTSPLVLTPFVVTGGVLGLGFGTGLVVGTLIDRYSGFSTWAATKYSGPVYATPATPTHPVPPIPNDPKSPPGPDWKWKGKGGPETGKGNWVGPGGSLHPDLNHPLPIGPHWDWIDPSGNKWRIPPGGGPPTPKKG